MRVSFQAVYIAPLKALVRERMEDWKVRLEKKLNKKYVHYLNGAICKSRLIGPTMVMVRPYELTPLRLFVFGPRFRWSVVCPWYVRL